MDVVDIQFRSVLGAVRDNSDDVIGNMSESCDATSYVYVLLTALMITSTYQHRYTKNK